MNDSLQHYYSKEKSNALLFCTVVSQNMEGRGNMEFPQSTQMRQSNLNNNLFKN